MDFPVVTKNHRSLAARPNLLDYEKACSAFSWEELRRELDGLPEGRGLNIAHEAVDRHAAGGRDRLAIRWLGREGAAADFTFGDLLEQTNRFANVLLALGIGRADRVFALAGRIPELYITALGRSRTGVSSAPFSPRSARNRYSSAFIWATRRRL
jgi:acetyl-CoA synthetase